MLFLWLPSWRLKRASAHSSTIFHLVCQESSGIFNTAPFSDFGTGAPHSAMRQWCFSFPWLSRLSEDERCGFSWRSPVVSRMKASSFPSPLPLVPNSARQIIMTEAPLFKEAESPLGHISSRNPLETPFTIDPFSSWRERIFCIGNLRSPPPAVPGSSGFFFSVFPSRQPGFPKIVSRRIESF